MGKNSSYSNEFKVQALKLSDEIGVKKTAEQLGIPYFTLADWRNRVRERIEGTSSDSSTGTALREQELRIRELEKAKAELRNENEILKEALVFFRQSPKEVKASVRYGYILENKDKHTVKAMCKALEVSESGYYRWLCRRGQTSGR